ncbi:hypothetical protein DKX38_020416 [Salix brachista]|uniref:Uncharacterized protein n=1 Tax=Salix brachista TaxID=2182728 RepID=A0A5N5K5A3_9ROSI|nr:hypothetical protein DKX38_020416 [Salix brachista]
MEETSTSTWIADCLVLLSILFYYYLTLMVLASYSNVLLVSAGHHSSSTLNCFSPPRIADSQTVKRIKRKGEKSA